MPPEPQRRVRRQKPKEPSPKQRSATELSATADTKRHTAWANRLNDVIVKKCKVVRGWNRASWTDEFRRLQQSVGGDHVRIDAVLSWWCDHVKDQYVPVVRSAASFRDKFLQLEEAMRRAGQGAKSSGRKATASERKVIDRVLQLGWPLGRDEIPAAFLESVDNLTAFRTELKKLCDVDHHDQRRRQYLYNRLTPSRIEPVLAAVESWFHEVYHRVVWDGSSWNGDLTRQVLSADNEWFRLKCVRILAEYGVPVPTVTWDEILKEISR